MPKTAKPRKPTTVAGYMVPELYRVVKNTRETHDCFTLDLVPADGSPRMKFAPGQFNMIYMFGVGEIPISVSGDPAGKTLVHTIREIGTVTKRLGALKPGDTVGIRGPFGTQWPMDIAQGSDVVVLAGGIAGAPVRPILYEIFNNRDRYGKLAYLYGARTPEDILYQKEFKKWKAEQDINIDYTVDKAGSDYKGNVGLVTALVGKAKHNNWFDPYNAVAMVCGPGIMMKFSIMELVKRGIPESRCWLSEERNMKCGIGMCGHCQCGPLFICKDGPVFRHDKVKHILHTREI